MSRDELSIIDLREFSSMMALARVCVCVCVCVCVHVCVCVGTYIHSQMCAPSHSIIHQSNYTSILLILHDH